MFVLWGKHSTTLINQHYLDHRTVSPAAHWFMQRQFQFAEILFSSFCTLWIKKSKTFPRPNFQFNDKTCRRNELMVFSNINLTILREHTGVCFCLSVFEDPFQLQVSLAEVVFHELCSHSSQFAGLQIDSFIYHEMLFIFGFVSFVYWLQTVTRNKCMFQNWRNNSSVINTEPHIWPKVLLYVLTSMWC